MVDRQVRARGITSARLLRALERVPREAFVPASVAEFALDDTPLPIAHGQTISQPYVVALMIDAAALQATDRVLEVGTGSGYAAAILAELARDVVTVERHADLADAARRRLDALGYQNVTVVAGDGSAGMRDQAPFDAILVAAREREIPQALRDQLAEGGRLVMPVGGEDVQTLRLVTRTGTTTWDERDLGEVRFVPLISGQAPSEGGTRAAGSHQPARPLPLPALIAQAGRPLPEIADPAFAKAFDCYADKRIIMLGEASHGTHEFYAARSAITRRLVEHHGFNIIAVEADWPDAAAINHYIRHGKAPGSATRPFQRFPSWMWRNTVVADLMDHLRAWNRGRDDERSQVSFHGLDIYNMSSSIAAVLAYLDAHDPAAAAVARERYACLAPWQSDPAHYGRMALTEGFAECERAVLEQCRELLSAALSASGGSMDELDAAMNARLVASAEQYYRVMYYGGAESWNLRDSHMAETLDYLLQARGAQAKAVVWAHNSHIGDARATDMGSVRGEHNLGQLTRERYGGEVALIGFGTHAGTVTCASDWDGPTVTKRVVPSRADSYERLCHDSGIPAFLLDLAPATAAGVRLAEPRLERFIGVIYRPETERWSHYAEASLSRQYDAWVWFDETAALTPLSEEHLTGHVPDTYPFGL